MGAKKGLKLHKETITLMIDRRFLVKKITPQITEHETIQDNVSILIISFGGGYKKSQSYKIKSSIGAAEFQFPTDYGKVKKPVGSQFIFNLDYSLRLKAYIIKDIEKIIGSNSNNNNDISNKLRQLLYQHSLNDDDCRKILLRVNDKKYAKYDIILSKRNSINQLLHHVIGIDGNNDDYEEYVVYDTNEDFDLFLLSLVNYEKRLLLKKDFEKLMKKGDVWLVSSLQKVN